ncbi:aldose 1-epimerase family protein [Demequina lignilytica]|uniref:Aldose 1-epimerase family protein n=1 Tax=Demequina lignilytica TaxID=3051663 RepID=A0AAW7M997_9MICO|nr:MULTISPECIES: aldose 1-epimerase family protein [unclassified Demequina]MDN4477852.1 aldose 1-epimerase family protein [Demequina sp. SYSU T00039-1]MDN4483491.1 aldose 1-epimerase family protein [Demequina sp. SYSU T0a273]MDN4487761.1 aldose 1-epimerase family protein [Demequina sp. SYSU T00039]MDN4490856.1 aldose 1-epimerase family protein [Demequina sp. SYSU T00068]
MDFISGDQITLTSGEQTATIATVGAALREYVVGGREVVIPFPADELPAAFHGMVLAPWPNRLRDGKYTFDGEELQVPVSEPGRGTALHGLVSWANWSVDSVSETAVTLAYELPASPGYPFQLALAITYALGEDGLTITTVARNVGARALPYGLGFHPWFAPGGTPVDRCTLQLDASSRVTVDDRLLPTGSVPVDGDFDLRAAWSLDGVAFDDAWVDVIPDGQGRSWARLGWADGSTVEIWAGPEAKAWQVCTGDVVEGVHRAGVAIEPMTCIADAFRTGDDLITLEPGAEHTFVWGMRLV